MSTLFKETPFANLNPGTFRAADRTGITLDHETLIANDIFGLEHTDPRARTFMLLRSQIMTGFHVAGGRVLVVTSTQTANGKSFVTANLACALSLIQPTILVDLDLRRPTMATRFGLEVKVGVDDYLVGDCEWEDVAQKVQGLDLTFYPVRKPRPESSTLLSQDRLAHALEKVRTTAHQPICIIDTPPALVLDDVMLIARSADGALLVVEEGRTTSKDLQEVIRLLESTQIVGTVLNKSITTGRGSYGYEYYDVK